MEGVGREEEGKREGTGALDREAAAHELSPPALIPFAPH
jgi:hypothetical protein